MFWGLGKAPECGNKNSCKKNWPQFANIFNLTLCVWFNFWGSQKPLRAMDQEPPIKLDTNLYRKLDCVVPRLLGFSIWTMVLAKLFHWNDVLEKAYISTEKGSGNEERINWWEVKPQNCIKAIFVHIAMYSYENGARKIQPSATQASKSKSRNCFLLLRAINGSAAEFQPVLNNGSIRYRKLKAERWNLDIHKIQRRKTRISDTKETRTPVFNRTWDSFQGTECQYWKDKNSAIFLTSCTFSVGTIFVRRIYPDTTRYNFIAQPSQQKFNLDACIIECSYCCHNLMSPCGCWQYFLEKASKLILYHHFTSVDICTKTSIYLCHAMDKIFEPKNYISPL